MEHAFTWYDLLPHALQELIPQHTFFAILIGLVLIFFAGRAKATLVRASDPLIPDEKIGTRNLAELLVYLIVIQSDAIVGKHGRKYVPYFGSFFFFILCANLAGLLPGFSPPTGNLNTTLGLALVSFIGYNVIGVREQGRKYFKEFLGPMTSLPASKNIFTKLAFFLLLLLSASFFFILEGFSHLFRPVSLAVRLFGNMMGDHTVIEVFIDLTKVVIPVAFYLLGTLVAVIQAFVFTLLSMIYVALAVSHGHGEEQGPTEQHQSQH
jgi:F-type H+-transporting ATPase subunit a